MAQRKTKAQKASTRRYKERIARQDKREPLRPIDVWALQVTEAYEALIRQGMKPTDAIWYIEAKTRLPDWLPQPPDDDHDDDELDY